MRPADPRVRTRLVPARGPLAGVAATGLVSGLLVIAQAWVVAGLVVAALDGDQVREWGAAVVVVLLARGLVGAAGEWLAARAAAAVGTSLRSDLVAAAVHRPRSGSSGEVAVLVTRGVSACEPYLTRYVPALVLAAVLPPLAVVAMATQDLLSAVIVLATLPLVPVFGALVGLATRDRAAEQWRAMEALSGHFVDVVRGLPTLVAHRRERVQSGRIAEVTDRYRIASLRTLRIAFASSAVLELVATLSVALVAVTVGVRLAQGSLDLGTALVVLLLAPEAYWPLRRVGAEFHAAAEGAATFEAADRLLSAQGSGDLDAPAEPGAPLVLDGLTMTYPGRTVPALAPVDARIPARGVTAVTGPSGCGKSTLLAVLAGLEPATDGTMTSHGSPVGGASWQSQVAWLPQQPQFVAGSIADNLRIVRPDATDADLWAALREVALELRVHELPRGIEQPLGEDGATLSAGERARLALARIVLADRPWVLLDEPTAHLDELTERVIADAVLALGRRSSVVVVAHRPMLVALADRRLELAPPAAGPRDRVARPAVTAAAPAGPAPDTSSRSDEEPAAAGFAASTVIGALASMSGVALTATAGWLIVQAASQPPVLTLLVAVVGVRAFGLARPVLRYVERLRAHDAALRLLGRRRVEVYDALVPLVPARLGRRRGDVLSAVVDDVDSVVDRQLRVRMPVRQFVLVAAVAALVATLVLPVAGAIVLACCAITGSVGYLLPRWGARRAEQMLVELRSRLSTEVLESVQVAEELLMWQATARATDRIARTARALGRAGSGAAAWTGAARAAALLTTGVAMAFIAALASSAVAGGSLTGPMLALLVLLPLALADVALPLTDAGALSVRTAAAESRLRTLERTAPAVRDTVAHGTPSGHDVTVERARARWAPGGALTEELSVRLAPGERVAVVGPSGVGKSTLAALLLRFLDPSSGRVVLGGCDTRSMLLADVRRTTGLVDDHPHVFCTTLVENVRLARPGATDAEVEATLRRARLGDWLDALPDGMHTWLGDGHAAVSGGERARIAIARSLLADQPVLVLDEPTAHLDSATASELARELLTSDRDRSVLWITHGTVGLDLVDGVVDLAEPARGPIHR
ncbi:thiol reductant ABC exporter subunit CydD [Nocardioides baculatus]|uniref:Thiol reductant ABC exporter subunit CydD n=1 Tax=Nocardioides baculatus TaxID=2801337 RepID=A0ABS1L9Z2_9ACTN|nr:thiol reductant ABC exporter subunit CydD [Nocardioides baculatus]MBL0748358.1 thiol reductant ABC exporter subunit CydD [Nocardioides baculatus]